MRQKMSNARSDTQKHRSSLLLGLLLAATFAIAASQFDVVTDPISGRQGHIPRAGARTSRRHLAAGVTCGAFVACPSAAVAAQMILGSNPNLTISDAIFSKGSCSSSLAQWGIIQNTSWVSGHVMASWFPRGALVLSSGDASAANCPVNTLDYYTGLVGGGGDANLNALIPAYTTYDAVALEFTVTALKDGLLVFKYAFGSDEYTEWVGTAFNDVFGFFIAPVSQPITTGHNVAIVKGTASTQVSINNVNGGSNANLWNNNRIGEVSSTKAIEADGYTNLLNTQGFQVTAGSQYRFKLAIADAGDQILDSWVWIGGETLLVDQKPIANATDPTTNCATKVATLNASPSYDPDTDDVLTYSWLLTAPCYPSVSLSGKVVTVDLTKLADGVTYTVTLSVFDKSDVEDTKVSTLAVPVGCGGAVVPTCDSGGNPLPSPSPPSTPSYNGGGWWYVSSNYVVAGGAGVVPCDGDISIDAGSTADTTLQLVASNYDPGDMYTVYYIWHVYDITDKSYDNPLASQTVVQDPSNPNPTVTFTAADLGQTSALKKYRVVLCVTDVDAWDQGNGAIISTPTFIQLLGCPIQPADPPTMIYFDAVQSPEPFTLACWANVMLDADAPYAAASATYGSLGTTILFRWSVRDSAGALIWSTDSSTSQEIFDATSLAASFIIFPNTFYSLSLIVILDGSDFDNDNWETKFSIEDCGFVASPPSAPLPPGTPEPPNYNPSPPPPPPPPSSPPPPPPPNPPPPPPPNPPPPPPPPSPSPPPPSRPPPSPPSPKPPSPKPPSPKPPSPRPPSSKTG